VSIFDLEFRSFIAAQKKYKQYLKRICGNLPIFRRNAPDYILAAGQSIYPVVTDRLQRRGGADDRDA